MSLNLKNFILSEEIKASHAAKFLDYQDNHHDEIQEELIEELSKEWKKLAEKFNRISKPDDKRLEDSLLKNPNAFTGIEFSNDEDLVGNDRFIKPKSTLMSVKISLVFTSTERHLLFKHFFDAASKVFEKVIKDNEKAFSITTPSGNIKPVFQVTKHDGSIKLQFKSTEKDKETGKNHEVVKTIFMVDIERGKEKSKTKFFDRIFLIDYTK